MKKSLIFLPFLLLFSCSVQKRHYQSGYFVSWKKHSSSPKENREEKKERASAKTFLVKEKNSEINPQAGLSASASDILSFKELKKAPVYKAPTDSCDILIYKDGTESQVKVIEISATQIKYKKCQLSDGPVFVSNKSELFMIKYVNGTNEVFKVPEASSGDVSKTPSPSSQNYPRGRIKKNTRLATLSVIFGGIGFYPLVFIGGLIAIIASLIQLNRIAAEPDVYGGERKAKAGLILGIASIVLWTMIIALIILTL